jgi:hypothetical protein
MPAYVSSCKWTAELNQRNQNSLSHLQAAAWYTKCPISLEPQDIEENGCTGNSLVIWHEVMGLWNSCCINLTLFDSYILGYLWALVYTEKTKSVAHFLKCIINACNTITSDTIYHVTADWIPHMHLWINHNGGHSEHILWIWANSIFFAYSSRFMAQLLNKQRHTKTQYKEKQV